LLARGPHLRALTEHGLTLQTPTTTKRLALPATDQPDWREGDVALLSVKSQDTATALKLIPGHVPVICAQNGVENEELVAASNPTIAMMVWIVAAHVSPGIVALYAEDSPGILDLGTIAGDERTATEVAGTLRDVGFDSVVREDIMEWKRAKLLCNLPGIFQVTTAPFDQKQAAALIAEGREVLVRAQLAHTNLDRFMSRVQGIRQVPIDGMDRPGGSLWQSMHRGSGTEVDYLNGYIARLGEEIGVPAPINAKLVAEVPRRRAVGR